MNKLIQVTVLIPCKELDSYTRECLQHTLNMSFQDYEVILLPDSDVVPISNVRIIPTGKVGPSQKRNIGIAHSRGQIIAFLDSDAYPDKDWLSHGIKLFSEPTVSAVGGPNVTPPGVGLLERACGRTLESFMAAFSLRYRYLPMKSREVDDFPACNLLVRKDDLSRVGGFDERFWPGEDTVLCLRLTQELGKRIRYQPEVLVYHHRRKLFLPYLKQIGRYAFTRGQFIRRFPQTSLRPIYFLHSMIMLVLCAAGALTLMSASWIGVAIFSLYIIMVIGSSLNLRDPTESILVSVGTVLTTLTYGTFFMAGLAKRRNQVS